jgi:hypothetical protein
MTDAPGPGFRLERLLPIACIAAAAILFASELMTTFEFTPPGAEPLADQANADRHSYAQAVLALFAIVGVVIAVSSGSKPAATAVAVCGVLALFIFLLLDLPDANNIGTLDDPRQSFFEAEAVPQEGFWFQLLGALGLAISGIALATLTPEQLVALGPGGGRKPKKRETPSSRGRTRRAVSEQPEHLGDEARDKPAKASGNASSPESRASAKSRPR